MAKTNFETKNWLRRAYRRDLLTQDEIDALREYTDILPLKLNAYLRSLGS